MQLHFNAFYVPATYSRTKVDNCNQSKGTSNRAHTTPLPCGSSVASKTHRVYSRFLYCILYTYIHTDSIQLSYEMGYNLSWFYFTRTYTYICAKKKKKPSHFENIRQKHIFSPLITIFLFTIIYLVYYVKTRTLWVFSLNIKKYFLHLSRYSIKITNRSHKNATLDEQ